ADKPDALLLDLMMPDIEGYEVCAELRKLPEFAKLPILIISARTDPASKRRAEDAGADAYFTKPVNMAQLVDKLESLFTERAAAPPAPQPAFSAKLAAPASPQPKPVAPVDPASSPAASTQPKRPAGLTEAASSPITPTPAPEPPAAATQPKRPAALSPSAEPASTQPKPPAAITTPDPSTPKPPPESTS
ncbi:MAG: response regulator, partial [Anaerolineae bacterium]|nr:response regulator [Anaerolineae bacterium]